MSVCVLRLVLQCALSITNAVIIFIIINGTLYLCLNTLKGSSCLKRSKLTFCYFLNGCSFSSIWVQSVLKSDITFLRYGNFIEVVMKHWWKIEFEIKALTNLWICTKCWCFGNSEVHFYRKTMFFTPNPSSNLKIKYWRFQNMWNFKINSGTIFWDIFDFASP